MDKKLYYLFQNLALIAQASGGIDARAREQLHKTAVDLEVADGEVEEIITAVTSGKEQNLRFIGTPEEKRRAFFLMCAMATPGGKITRTADAILRRVASHYDISEKDLEELLGQVEVVEGPPPKLPVSPSGRLPTQPQAARPPAASAPAGAPAPAQPAAAAPRKPAPAPAGFDPGADIILGRLAVLKGFITEEQVDHCVHLQESLERLGVQMSFGQILVGEGYLKEEQLKTLLTCHERAVLEEGRRFGSLVVKNGLTTAEKVDKALWAQGDELKKLGKARPLGEILVSQGSITEQELQAIVRAQTRIAAPAKPAAK